MNTGSFRCLMIRILVFLERRKRYRFGVFVGSKWAELVKSACCRHDEELKWLTVWNGALLGRHAGSDEFIFLYRCCCVRSCECEWEPRCCNAASAVHGETEHAARSLINDVACGGMCAEQLMTRVTLPFQLSLATCHSYEATVLWVWHADHFIWC